jgi:hypothetical protein
MRDWPKPHGGRHVLLKEHKSTSLWKWAESQRITVRWLPFFSQAPGGRLPRQWLLCSPWPQSSPRRAPATPLASMLSLAPAKPQAAACHATGFNSLLGPSQAPGGCLPRQGLHSSPWPQPSTQAAACHATGFNARLGPSQAPGGRLPRHWLQCSPWPQSSPRRPPAMLMASLLALAPAKPQGGRLPRHWLQCSPRPQSSPRRPPDMLMASVLSLAPAKPQAAACHATGFNALLGPSQAPGGGLPRHGLQCSPWPKSSPRRPPATPRASMPPEDTHQNHFPMRHVPASRKTPLAGSRPLGQESCWAMHDRPMRHEGRRVLLKEHESTSLWKWAESQRITVWWLP